MKRAGVIYPILCAVLVNMYVLLAYIPWLLVVLLPLYLYVLIFAGVFSLPTKSQWLRQCYHGGILLHSFLFSTLTWQVLTPGVFCLRCTVT